MTREEELRAVDVAIAAGGDDEFKTFRHGFTCEPSRVARCCRGFERAIARHIAEVETFGQAVSARRI